MIEYYGQLNQIEKCKNLIEKFKKNTDNPYQYPLPFFALQKILVLRGDFKNGINLMKEIEKNIFKQNAKTSKKLKREIYNNHFELLHGCEYEIDDKIVKKWIKKSFEYPNLLDNCPLQAAPSCFKLLQTASSCSKLLQVASSCFKLLQVAPSCFNLLPNV